MSIEQATSAQATSEAAPVPTLLRVEHGSPTAEELAALTVLLAAMTAGSVQESAPQRPHSFGWGSGWRAVRRPYLRDRAWGGW